MSDHETDLHARLSKLEDAFIQQAEGMVTLVANTNTLAEQLFALFLVNTALAAALRERDLLDVDQIRTRALEGLTDEQRAGTTGLHVNAVTGTLTPTEPVAPGKSTAEELRERALARFTVFEGGQSTDKPGS